MPPSLAPELPKPRRRLWRTLWHWPRNVTHLAPPIPIADVLSPRPTNEEAAHWGQYSLLEDYVTVLHRDGTPTYRCRQVVVLHSVMEIERWERFEYRFDRRSWNHTIRRARMILPNGKERRAAIRNRSVNIWGPSRVLVVAFSQLSPGVVVELEDQQDNFIPYADCPGVWGDFALQTPHPCRRRRIIVAVAQPFSAQLALHNGAPAPTEHQVADYRIWTWDVRDIPGIEWDQVTPPLYEFAPWIDFSTIPSWKPIARHYFKHLKIPKNHDLQGLASTLSAKEEGLENKLAAAYTYAAHTVRSSRPKEHAQELAIRPLGAVAEELRGDCKDKSALLVALLQTLDIKAGIVAVRTSQEGRFSLLPGIRFDHALVLAKVDGKELWLDPSAGAYSLGQLPSCDQGVQGLILDRNAPQPTSIPAANPADHRLERSARGRLEGDGSYSIECTLRLRGDRAAGWRNGLLERNSSTRDRLLRQYLGASLPSAEISEVSSAYLDDLNGDLTLSYRAVIRNLGRRIQELMLLRIPWLEAIRDNGFYAAASRPQPLLTPICSVSDRQHIELPLGFSGYGLPWEHVERCDWGYYRCRVRIENGALCCERDFELLGGIVPPERYEEMRRFTDACIESDARDIVLIEPKAD